MDQHSVAFHYLGRSLRAEERPALDILPSAPVQLDANFDARKKDCLIVAACYAASLRHYLRNKAEFAREYNIHVIMTLPAYIEHIVYPTPELVKTLFAKADVILCHSFLGSFEGINTAHHPGKSSRKSIVFAPPNNTTFWPICTNAGVELRRAIHSGRTKQQIWGSFVDGTFDCRFEERTATQKAWSVTRETDADIKIAPFVEDMFRDCKLWFTANHPTYNLIAWIGSEFLRLLGYPADSISTILAYPPDATSMWNACPETHYEFKHYGLRYPLRWPALEGGFAFYKHLIMSCPLDQQAESRA